MISNRVLFMATMMGAVTSCSAMDKQITRWIDPAKGEDVGEMSVERVICQRGKHFKKISKEEEEMFLTILGGARLYPGIQRGPYYKISSEVAEILSLAVQAQKELEVRKEKEQ